MKDYSSNCIKNVAIVGQASCGKTSLVEALLYTNMATDRLGKITDGNTVSDYDPEEIKRKASISLSASYFEKGNVKVNLLDAPGLFDFEAGMYEAITACDTAVIALSGKSGVAVGTKRAYNLATKLNKSKAFFVGKLDTENADFYKVLEGLKATFGPSVCPVVVPHYNDKVVDCYVNLIDMKAFKYENGKSVEIPLPNPDPVHRFDGLITAISEAVAETDEALFEKYFSGEAFTHDELIKGVHDGIKAGTITPVFCGSALTLEAIDLLVDDITSIFPSSDEVINEVYDENNKLINIDCNVNDQLVLYVFKTFADPFVGKLSLVKILSGKLTSNLTTVNMTTEQEEKLGKILILKGKKQEEVPSLCAGDIAAITKLNANTGDTLCVNCKYIAPKTEYLSPCYSMAILPKGKGDESKISTAITRLLEEDLTLKYFNNVETHQQIISGLGEQHLDVVVSKLKSKFGIDVELLTPLIAYRETIKNKVRVEGKHKKQSGGHGQFGHVWIEFEPCDSSDLVFEQTVVGGAVPKNFFPAVEKGLRESIIEGVIAGYPVVGLKATLCDGSYHPVDSSEASFKMAAALAYRNGLAKASPVLLEPINRVLVTVPDDNTGDMMGELNKRRGRVLGMNPIGEEQSQVEAEVPASEMHDFSSLIRQMTKGAGSFTSVFERYEALPNLLEAEVIAKAKAMREKSE